MNPLKSLRPIASRIQPTSLPRLYRPFSASASRKYEYIQVSEPKPGVGQGDYDVEVANISQLLTSTISYIESTKGAQRPVHAIDQRAQ